MPSVAGTLISTGIVLGILHVLTGPDHLSAIATLSANLSSCRQAFGLGVRWGIGHSTGLLIVGIILIVISDASQDTLSVSQKLTTIFESLVGVFMIILGFYGLMRAIRKHGNKSNREEDTPLAPLASPSDGTSLSLVDGHQNTTSMMTTGTTSINQPDFLDPQCKPSKTDSRLEVDHGHEHCPHSIKCCFTLTNKLSTNVVAVLVGIVHGFAGPGGVLGVIPAVQIRDAKLSTLYLGTFCLSSTLTMGCFASLYGIVSNLVANKNGWEFRVECVSACLSIVVGITWLILVALGKLDQIFP